MKLKGKLMIGYEQKPVMFEVGSVYWLSLLAQSTTNKMKRLSRKLYS